MRSNWLAVFVNVGNGGVELDSARSILFGCPVAGANAFVLFGLYERGWDETFSSGFGMLNRVFGRFVRLADAPKSGSCDLWDRARMVDATVGSSWPKIIVLRPLTGLGDASMGAFRDDSSQCSLSSVDDSLPHSEHDDLEQVESGKWGKQQAVTLLILC